MLVIPILWKHLLSYFFKVFAMINISFLSLLILTRLIDIAKFTTLGVGIDKILLYALYQFPLILPYTIPISALFASFMLFQRLCKSHELTSLRASGVSIGEVIYPLAVAGFLLTLLNFVIVSEWAPQSKLKSRNLLYLASATNPLILLESNQLSKVKDTFVHMDIVRSGQAARNLLFAYKNPTSQKLNLIRAGQFSIGNRYELIGEHVAFVSYIESKKPSQFDHLLLENQQRIENSAESIASLLHESDIRKMSPQKMKTHALLAKIRKNTNYDALTEMIRRIALSMTTLIFIILGAFAGLCLDRSQTRSSYVVILLLVILNYVGIRVAKMHAISLLVPLSLTILPQVLCMLYAFYKRSRFIRGVH